MSLRRPPLLASLEISLVVGAVLVAALSGRRTDAREPAAGTAAPDWLADPGTAVLGLGLLRVAPAVPGVAGEVVLRHRVPGYTEEADYGATPFLQLMVLPSDAFAETGRAFADRAIAFAHSKGAGDAVTVRVSVSAPALLIVGYGPYDGPDVSRPITLARPYVLEVSAVSGATYRWVDPEAGELNVKGWTNRPEVKRGGPVEDTTTKTPHWFEARPEIFYDRERMKAPGDAETSDTAARRREADSLASRAKDLRAAGKADVAKELETEASDILRSLAAGDDRVAVPDALAVRMRRLPFRWK